MNSLYAFLTVGAVAAAAAGTPACAFSPAPLAASGSVPVVTVQLGGGGPVGGTGRDGVSGGPPSVTNPTGANGGNQPAGGGAPGAGLRPNAGNGQPNGAKPAPMRANGVRKIN